MATVSKITVNPAPAQIAPAVFERLGLYGLRGLDAVLLAALATEEPLLLIGAHGTGKTLLLTRVADALALSFRHYNASLLNFDDLVGFPLPGKDGTLEYVKTPAAIWGAQAVLFDEISRCRPDIQNKIFPIVHERKVQGLALSGLRFRWAAMNPPMTEEDESGYVGSEPLDAALADRFTYVVAMPEWDQLTDAEQLAIISADSWGLNADAAPALASRLANIRALLPSVTGSLKGGIGIYIQVLHRLLGQAGIRLSPRRAGMLCRSAIAVHCAAVTLDATASMSDSLLLAVRHGLPQRAEGKKISETALLAAHKEAWRFAAVKPDDPMKAILMANDPIDRARLAMASPGLKKTEFSGVIADSLAQLTPGARAAFVVHLFETGAAGRLNAAIAEQTATLYRDIVTPINYSQMMSANDPQHEIWRRLKDLLSRLDPANPRAHLCANALVASFAGKQFNSPNDAESAFHEFTATDRRLTGVAKS